MGNSESSRKQSRLKDIEELAEYIKSDKCKQVVVMLGAGASTSAGIPDYRSPNKGLYSILAKLKLPHPGAVFDINYFRRNPVPFYTLAAELYPGFYRPTPTHSFVKLLSTHNLLRACFTQNIDTLERRAGVPMNELVEAHGSFATQSCIDCGTPFDDDEMRAIILAERAPGETVRIPRCKEENCGGLVKPDVVLFGESLPDLFLKSMRVVTSVDLLLIIGTSLTVYPFASLAGKMDNRCRRVLINLDRAGDIGRRSDDIVLLGECDVVVRELCAALGWAEELEKAWGETESKSWANVEGKGTSEKGGKEEDMLEKKIDTITDALRKQLDLAEGPKEELAEADSSATAEEETLAGTEVAAEEAPGGKL